MSLVPHLANMGKGSVGCKEWVYAVSSSHLASKTSRRGVECAFRLTIEAGGRIGKKAMAESTICQARIGAHKQSGEVPTGWEKGPSGISIVCGNIGGDTHQSLQLDTSLFRPQVRGVPGWVIVVDLG